MDWSCVPKEQHLWLHFCLQDSIQEMNIKSAVFLRWRVITLFRYCLFHRQTFYIVILLTYHRDHVKHLLYE